MTDKLQTLLDRYNALRDKGKVHSQRDMANLLGVNESNLSRAFNGDERYLTNGLIKKVIEATKEEQSNIPIVFGITNEDNQSRETLPVLPTSARAGTLGDFADSIKEYECEQMISPIKGADYAMSITGESMTPEYPNGSTIIIKKVSGDFIEWGRCYCLDTADGAVIKLIYPTDKPDVVECRSINPAFPPFKVKADLIRGWYRVLMCLSLK